MRSTRTPATRAMTDASPGGGVRGSGGDDGHVRVHRGRFVARRRDDERTGAFVSVDGGV
jgi:hypothetical protein